MKFWNLLTALNMGCRDINLSVDNNQLETRDIPTLSSSWQLTESCGQHSVASFSLETDEAGPAKQDKESSEREGICFFFTLDSSEPYSHLLFRASSTTTVYCFSQNRLCRVSGSKGAYTSHPQSPKVIQIFIASGCWERGSFLNP